MSQSREKPKFVAPPPPAHQAIHPIKFTHSVPEYTAKRRNKRALKKQREISTFSAKMEGIHMLPVLKKLKTLTHPEDVDSAYQQLVGSRYFLFNVLVKTWLYFYKLGQGWKVIGPL